MKDPLTAGSPEHRAARRAAVKLHHPDRGGSTEDLASALDAVNERLVSPRFQQIPPIRSSIGTESSMTRMMRTTAPSHLTGLLRTTGRRAVHRVRRMLPRWVPGSRRYIQL